MSPEDLRTEHFEIILTLEGIVPETGNNIQVFLKDLTSSNPPYLVAAQLVT